MNQINKSFSPHIVGVSDDPIFNPDHASKPPQKKRKKKKPVTKKATPTKKNR